VGILIEAKCRPTLVAADLANRRAFRISHPHWGCLVGEVARAAPAKRLNRTVKRLIMHENSKSKRFRKAGRPTLNENRSLTTGNQCFMI